MVVVGPTFGVAYRGVIGSGVTLAFVVGVGFGMLLLFIPRLVIAYFRDVAA